MVDSTEAKSEEQKILALLRSQKFSEEPAPEEKHGTHLGPKALLFKRTFAHSNWPTLIFYSPDKKEFYHLKAGQADPMEEIRDTSLLGVNLAGLFPPSVLAACSFAGLTQIVERRAKREEEHIERSKKRSTQLSILRRMLGKIKTLKPA